MIFPFWNLYVSSFLNWRMSWRKQFRRRINSLWLSMIWHWNSIFKCFCFLWGVKSCKWFPRWSTFSVIKLIITCTSGYRFSFSNWMFQLGLQIRKFFINFCFRLVLFSDKFPIFDSLFYQFKSFLFSVLFFLLFN